MVEAGTASGDPEYLPEGVTHDMAGVVVEEEHAGNHRNVYVYEGDRLVREEHENAAGVVDMRQTYTYDGDRLVQKDHDNGADGTVEVRWTWAYDDAGRKVREERDDGADGAPEARWEWAYDAAGRLVTERHDLRLRLLGVTLRLRPRGRPDGRARV